MNYNFNDVQAQVGNIGRYQLLVFLATQLGYLSVTGSMLSTVFDTLLPDGINCTSADEIANETLKAWNSAEFGSLLLELGFVCETGYIPTSFSTAVMVGGVLGAAATGYLADRFGRKISCIVTLGGVMLMNLIIAALALYSYILTLFLFFVLGFFGGGYMVVNLVMLLESVGGAEWRLGATALNGWPLGLMVMAFLGYMTKYWRWYHVSLAVVALPCLIAQFWMHESARWLLQHSKVDRAETILRKIAFTNRRVMPSKLNFDDISPGVAVKKSPARDRNYSYLDLFRYRSILISLAALFYSWLASSIISFGIYFNMNNVWGNVFLKMFLLGLFKGTTGVIPYVVSRWVGRKPVLVVAVTLACLSCWAVVVIYFASSGHKSSPWLTAFSLIGASAVDPIWKVNHLYSTELFPTVIRNMARAVCNVGSRIGSVVGPQVAYLDSIHFALPYIIFGVLSVFHVAVCVFLLPETKDKPLPDRLPEDITDNREESLELRDVNLGISNSKPV